MILDLGGIGKNNQDITNVNLYEPCDVIHDLNVFPYPFENISIDKLEIIHTLEHLKEPLKVMQEIYRICKQNAVIKVVVPTHTCDETEDPLHIQGFKDKWFRKLCNGFNSKMQLQSCHWVDYDYQIIKIYYQRGKFLFWNKYNMTVLLRVRK